MVLYKNSTCPVGHYCPEGTKSAYDYKCPRGTFSGETGLQNVTQCSPCIGGFYCPEFGQSTFTLQCNAGRVNVCEFVFDHVSRYTRTEKDGYSLHYILNLFSFNYS